MRARVVGTHLVAHPVSATQTTRSNARGILIVRMSHHPHHLHHRHRLHRRQSRHHLLQRRPRHRLSRPRHQRQRQAPVGSVAGVHGGMLPHVEAIQVEAPVVCAQTVGAHLAMVMPIAQTCPRRRRLAHLRAHLHLQCLRHPQFRQLRLHLPPRRRRGLPIRNFWVTSRIGVLTSSGGTTTCQEIV